MSLRIRVDVTDRTLGLDPLSPRAVAWLEQRVSPLGGGWRKTGNGWTFSLPLPALPEDLLGTSGLVLYFGDPWCDAVDQPLPGPDLCGPIVLH